MIWALAVAGSTLGVLCLIQMAHYAYYLFWDGDEPEQRDLLLLVLSFVAMLATSIAIDDYLELQGASPSCLLEKK